MLTHVDQTDGGLEDDAAQGDATQADAAAVPLVSDEHAAALTPPPTGASSASQSARGGRPPRGARGGASESRRAAATPVPFGPAFTGRGRSRGCIDPSQFQELLVRRLAISSR